MVKCIIVWLLCAVTFVLGGCSTTHSIKGPYRIFPSTQSQVSEQTTSVTTEEISQSNQYQYGRFTVRVANDGSQKVEGGIFTPPATMPIEALKVHIIFINYTTKELSYYKRTNAGMYEPVIGYAVMTPHADVLPKKVVRGKVLRIVEKPTWCPKVGGTVRQANPDLPGCMPHGHPLNAMGDWRFDMAWDSPGWELNKLHGVNGYASGEFWTEKTHGCTRLTNEEIKNLITLLGPNAIKEGIEIVAFRGKAQQEKEVRQAINLAE